MITVGGWLYKFYNDRYVIIKDRDESKLLYANSLTESNVDENVTISSTRVNELKAQHVYEDCDVPHGDKKMWACLERRYVIERTGYGGAIDVYYIDLKLKQRRKNWRGKWKNSKTKFTAADIEYNSVSKGTKVNQNDVGTYSWTMEWRYNFIPPVLNFYSMNHSRGTVGWCEIDYN